MNSFNTTYLDKVLCERRDRLEQQRQEVLQQVFDWLDCYGERYGLDKAYVFGSLVRPGRFREDSDVDLAVEAIDPDRLFQLMANLSEAVGRDVDLVELPKCHFAHRIRERGMLWTQTG